MLAKASIQAVRTAVSRESWTLAVARVTGKAIAAAGASRHTRSMNQVTPHTSHWGAFDAVVQNGRIVDVRPFARDADPSPIIYGAADAVHAANRIDRPYVRKGWLNGDRSGGTPRGNDPFVPLDWDQATRLVADELTRVRDAHGPASVFGGCYGWSSAGRFHHAKTQVQRMLAATGGFTNSVTSYSHAAAQMLLPHVVGDFDCALGPIADWRGIARHAKLMICFGGIALRNGQVTNGGGGVHEMRHWLRQASQAGVRLVNVSPQRCDMPDEIACEWLPIRPGTDTALMLAMAYVLIDEDRIDHGFLQRCTVGFGRVAAYVRGEADGTPKTPAWAAAETGIPADTIAMLARDCAAAPTMLTACWSLQRAEHGEQPYWMLVALAAMLGGIGKPGTGFGFGFGSSNGMGSPRMALPSAGMTALRNPANSFIPVARIADMLENPGAEYQFNGRTKHYPDVRLVYWAGGNPFHHHQDLNRFEHAWARLETIVVHEPWWTPAARLADIVLPATTTLERDDIASSSRDRYIMAMKQAVPPQGQARNDFDICADIADALGVRDTFTGQRDANAWLRHLYDRWRTNCAKLGVAVPDFATFWAEGSVEIPVPEALFVPYAKFVGDPEAQRLNTPTGRIELYSATIDSFGYADCPGHPVWIAPCEYLGSPRAADYPLHLLTVQPATRLHSQWDHVGVSRNSKIAGREPLTLHADDAAERGIAEGDVVRVFNDRGACLAGVRLTRDMLRGVAVLATGAWLDSRDGLCVHGNPNVLTQDVGTSRLAQGPVAQSCLVEVERFTGDLPPVRAHQPPPIEAVA
jgi:biotin/methionine sulfoxide reductase